MGDCTKGTALLRTMAAPECGLCMVLGEKRCVTSDSHGTNVEPRTRFYRTKVDSRLHLVLFCAWCSQRVRGRESRESELNCRCCSAAVVATDFVFEIVFFFFLVHAAAVRGVCFLSSTLLI